MTYEEYLASPAWARLRSKALARDGFRCRGCGSTERLEVHHVRYGDPLGSETAEDLTTLCGGPDGCHHAITEAILRRQYEKRRYVAVSVARHTPGKHEVAYVLPAYEISPHRRLTPGHAQRAAGEPARPDGEGAEGHLKQAGQDRR